MTTAGVPARRLVTQLGGGLFGGILAYIVLHHLAFGHEFVWMWLGIYAVIGLVAGVFFWWLGDDRAG